MQSVSKSISDLLFEFKDKISDKEYMDMMNLLKKLNTSEEEHKSYKVTFCFSSIETEHERCEHHNHYTSTNYTSLVEIKSIITKIIKCKNIADFNRQSWCSNCLRDEEQCMRIIPLTSFLDKSVNERLNNSYAQKYLSLQSLKNACDHSTNVINFFNTLNELLEEKQLLYCFKKINVSQCGNSDNDDDDEDITKSNYDIDYNLVHIDIRFRILSIEEVQ